MIEHEQQSYEFNSSMTPFEMIIWNDSVIDMNPESVKKWLKDPMVYNKQVRDLSNKLYNANGIYTNVIDYTVSIPTLDRVIYSIDKQNKNYSKKSWWKKASLFC